jgi:hypothetical protein
MYSHDVEPFFIAYKGDVVRQYHFKTIAKQDNYRTRQGLTITRQGPDNYKTRQAKTRQKKILDKTRKD